MPPPVPSSGGHIGGWMQLDGLGLVQPETMQEEREQESACPFPGPSKPCRASGETGAPGPTLCHPPPCVPLPSAQWVSAGWLVGPRRSPRGRKKFG